MADQTANIVAYSAGVSVVSATLAGVLASRATTPLSQNPWFMLCIVIAIVSFAVLLLVGLRLVWTWWRDRSEAASLSAAADPEPDTLPRAAQQSALPAVDPVVWMPTCEESGQFPEGKSLVFRLSQAPGPGSAIRRFTEFRCTVTDPAGGTVESTGTDSWRQYTRFVFPGAPQVQPGRYRSRWQGRLQAGEWIDIASGEHEVKPSLVVSVLDDSQFRNFRRIALIAALHVQVENATDTAMDAIGYIHDVDAGGYWATGLTADEKTSVDREIGRLDETQEYGLPVRYVRRIGPCQTASGWFLVPVKMVAAGGSPAVAVIVRDETGNQYRATLPERQPQTYGG